jgi:anti-anti-sigma regulatory factor
MAVFIEVLRKVRTWQGKVVLFGLQKRVQGMVEIARLGSVFAIAPDEATALQA